MKRSSVHFFLATFLLMTVLVFLADAKSPDGAFEELLPARVETKVTGTASNQPNQQLKVSARGPAKILTHVDTETAFREQGFSRDGEPLVFEWDFDGDGVFDARSDRPFITHTYRRAGTYKAVFKVTGSGGESHTAVTEVVVNEGGGTQKDLQTVPTVLPQAMSTVGADGNPRYYAVMINGGSEERFWVDVDGFYSTLINRYQLSPDNIFLLNYNGLNYYGTNPSGMIDYPATLANVNAVFSQLAGVIDGDDTLLVWITDHGLGYAGVGYQKAYAIGYLDGEASVDPGDEQDYRESEFKLRSLITGGDYIRNHGMDEWAVSRFINSITGLEMYYRHKYVSVVNSLQLEDGSVVNNSDIFIEEIKDYLKGDTNRDGYIDPALGERSDFDGDGIPPYDPANGAVDPDDWGKPDAVLLLTWVNTGVPGGNYCLFDAGFDNHIDIDIDCPCDQWHLENCQTSLLHVDGTDLDNQGLFDGIDVNSDGDKDDWVSIDELVSLSDVYLPDDTLRNDLAALNVGHIIVVMEPCFSGGFVEDLSSNKTVIMTATVEEALSWGNLFVRNFTTAVGDPSVSDLNGDGLVSMAEAFNYAAANDTNDEVPQYDDNGDTLSTPLSVPNAGDGSLGSFLYVGSSPYCGNGICEVPMGENCQTCSADCPSLPAAVCGDGICNGSLSGETGLTCPQDCPIDIIPGGGTCSACQRGACDGVCNTKREGSACFDCNPGYTHNCGNSICEAGENASTCPVDCGTPPPVPSTCCGNAICESGENVTNCLFDCGCKQKSDCALIDDGNECTLDTCTAGVCANLNVKLDTPCSSGYCVNGSCTTPACTTDLSCDDGIACTVDTCSYPDHYYAYCQNLWPLCGIADGCCSPSCGSEDPDCQTTATCSACSRGVCDGVCNSRKEGPDCADCQ